MGSSGLMIQFSSTSTGSIDTYEWDFGALGIRTVANPTVQFNADGFYSVKLRVSGPEGFSSIEKQSLIEIDNAVTHIHGPEGEHSHGEIAFTTWLDPQLAMLQAEAVAAAIVVARPDAASDVDANLAALRKDLEALDQRLEAATSELGDDPLLPL